MTNLSPELKNRIATGGIGGSLLVLLLVYGGWVGAFLLITGISLMMVYEFMEITLSMPDRTEKRYVVLSLSWLMALFNRLAPLSELPLLIGAFLILFVYFLVTAKRHDEAALSTHFRELMISFFSIAYLVVIPFYFLKIYESTSGVGWAILFLLIVWSSDIGAYFAGRRYGRRKLYPRISPKKTVEGSLGGLLASLVITLLYKAMFFRGISIGAALILPTVVAVFAQIGDLCESFFKRACSVKDSGSILPGHGGFLDRFDGVVFSLPVMYACIRLFG